MERTRKKRLGNKCIALFTLSLILFNCNDNTKNKESNNTKEIAATKATSLYEFGFNLDNYIVKKDVIKNGDTFGAILDKNHVSYTEIYNIVEKIKDTYDIRRLQIGKPFTLLCTKDSLQKPTSFIYQPNKEDYVVINFKDSIYAYKSSKPIKYVEREISANITSTISEALDDKGISFNLAYKMSDIYAWTIDFTRLQKNDKFKVIYTEKFIDDSIYAGIHNIKAAYFEHNKEPFYAFEFKTDTVLGLTDYFNEDAKNLRRAFLKAPVAFKRISSRYNLRRRIAIYGNKIRPHKGTDFTAAIGTPIVATANGTVSKSSYTRGNGNYVKVKHNSTYSTQYLHMKKRKVKVGEFVKQGDVIGWVGMTGNTSGPHVCYRFWKNGKQVDPFKQKLPEAEPISNQLKKQYLKYISPIKKQLDAVPFEGETINIELDQDNQITTIY